MAQFGPLSHLVGMTKKRKKRKHQSRTDGNNRGKAAKLVTYCPICIIPNMGDPETAPRQIVSSSSTKGACPKGHIWSISTRAYSEPLYQLEAI